MAKDIKANVIPVEDVKNIALQTLLKGMNATTLEISVVKDTDTEYILHIKTDLIEFDTPNLIGKQGIQGEKGDNGKDATINGLNTLNILEGENITITQADNNLTISSSGSGEVDYNKLENKPQIQFNALENNQINEKTVTLENIKELSDLGITQFIPLDLANNEIIDIELPEGAYVVSEAGDFYITIGQGQLYGTPMGKGDFLYKYKLSAGEINISIMGGNNIPITLKYNDEGTEMIETYSPVYPEDLNIFKRDIDKEIAKKQDTLTAGENITIENNVISATSGSSDKTYVIDVADIKASTKKQEILDMFTEFHPKLLAKEPINLVLTWSSEYNIQMKLLYAKQNDKGTEDLYYFICDIYQSSNQGVSSYGIGYKCMKLLCVVVPITDAIATNYYLNDRSLIIKENYYDGPLGLANTEKYTPTGDYNPATKKYVDDAIATLSSSSVTAPKIINETELKALHDQTGSMADGQIFCGSLYTLYGDGLYYLNVECGISNSKESASDNCQVGTTIQVMNDGHLILCYMSNANNAVRIFKTSSYVVDLNSNYSVTNVTSDKIYELYSNLSENTILTTNNTTEFTPASDYNPTSKKYVDEKVIAERSIYYAEIFDTNWYEKETLRSILDLAYKGGYDDVFIKTSDGTRYITCSGASLQSLNSSIKTTILFANLKYITGSTTSPNTLFYGYAYANQVTIDDNGDVAINSTTGLYQNSVKVMKDASLLTGYDETKTQVLKNVNGTLTWVDES